MAKYPLQPQDKYVLRLPDGMRARIKRAAEENNRSMNAEIIAALEEKFPEPSIFDLGTFLTELSAAANRAAGDMKEVGRLVREANAKLERNSAEWRVVRSFENNKTRLTIVHRSDFPNLEKIGNRPQNEQGNEPDE